jgi:hypothetical protein
MNLVDVECIPTNDSSPRDLGLEVSVDIEARRPTSTVRRCIAGRSSLQELRVINRLDGWGRLCQSEEQAEGLKNKRSSHIEDNIDQKNVRSKSEDLSRIQRSLKSVEKEEGPGIEAD